VDFPRNPSAQPVGEIRALNTIRGVAALAVALFHAPTLVGVTTTLPHAYLGVDLFFVLSGFVMVHAYEARILGGLGFGRFMQLRLARLYPLLALATLAGFAVWLMLAATGHASFSAGASIAALPLSLALLPTSAGVAYPFCTQSWSILWEILLCVGLFAWFRWVGRGALFIAVTAAIALLFVAMDQGKVDGGWTAATFWIGGVRALSAFSAGVVVRYATRDRRSPILLKALAVTAALVACIYVAGVRQTTWWSDYLIVAVAFPLIIAGAANGGWPLENWAGDRLGEASYSIYLLHNLTIVLLGPVGKLARHFGPGAGMVFYLAWMAGLIAWSWACWRWVEMPLRRWVSGLELPRPRPRYSWTRLAARVRALQKPRLTPPAAAAGR
jgi:peptidoglycan/LPS O-acetylase OafA/YrhL